MLAITLCNKFFQNEDILNNRHRHHASQMGALSSLRDPVGEAPRGLRVLGLRSKGPQGPSYQMFVFRL